jgi:hypothetical protein
MLRINGIFQLICIRAMQGGYYFSTFKKRRRSWLKSIIRATWEGDIGRIAIQGQPSQKPHETLFQAMVGLSGVPLTSLATQGRTNRMMVVQARPGQA